MHGLNLNDQRRTRNAGLAEPDLGAEVPIGCLAACAGLCCCIALVCIPLAVVQLIALFDRSRGSSDWVVIAAQVLFCLSCIGIPSKIITDLARSHHPADPAKGKKIGLTILQLSITLASAVTMGIALFDRSRGINDGVVIAAAVLLFTGSMFVGILGIIKNPPVAGSNIEAPDIRGGFNYNQYQPMFNQ